MTNQERCEGQFPSTQTQEYINFLQRLSIADYPLPSPEVIFNAGIAAGIKLASEGKVSGTPLTGDNVPYEILGEDSHE